MTLEEYKTESKRIKEQFEVDIKNLTIKYALSNNPYSKGDIIEDDLGNIIKIEHIATYLDYSDPCCIYRGLPLRKNLTPMAKKKDLVTLYQRRIINKLNPDN